MIKLYKDTVYKLLVWLSVIPVLVIILIGSLLLWKSPILLLDKLNSILDDAL